MEFYENIFYEKGRFFVDIAESGCGSSCIYCYVEKYNGRQKLIDKIKFKNSLNGIIADSRYRNGKHGSIITLCPNTEPFKSTESAKLIVLVLKKFLPLGNPIQISTKEKVPEFIFKFIQENAIDKNQIFLNISTSTISKARLVEPNAANPEERFENFNLAKTYDKVVTCLYIKPITKYTVDDKEIYISIIKKYKPDTICVGLNFLKSKDGDRVCNALYKSNDILKSICSLDINRCISEFSNAINFDNLIPIFHSSICVIAYRIDKNPELNIWRKNPELCTNCRGCKDLT